MNILLNTKNEYQSISSLISHNIPINYITFRWITHNLKKININVSFIEIND